MTDEKETQGQEPETEATAGVAEQTEGAAPEGEGEGEEEAKKLHQTVEMRDVGPCKKHIKVTVEDRKSVV